MRDAVNIQKVSQLGVDWIGLNFCPGSPQYVRQISSNAGIIPDYGSLDNVYTKDNNFTNIASKAVVMWYLCR